MTEEDYNLDLVPPAAKETCVVCSQEFGKDNMVCLEDKWVCAECKPILVQKIREGMSFADLTVARKKKVLVMGKNAQLPDRCVKCNAPAAAQPLKRNLSWHSPVIYLALLLNILIYAIIAMCTSKKATIHIGVCEKHLSKRKTNMMVAWGLVLLCAILIGVAIAVDLPALMIVGIFLLLAGIIYGMATVPMVSARKIDKEYVWINGACKDYLDALPEWVRPS